MQFLPDRLFHPQQMSLVQASVLLSHPFLRDDHKPRKYQRRLMQCAHNQYPGTLYIVTLIPVVSEFDEGIWLFFTTAQKY